MDKDNTDSEKEYELEYSQITENIYLGSDLCSPNVCKLHEPEFKKLGVTVEISLTAELKDTPTNNVVIYSWIPVPDEEAPSDDQLDLGTDLINKAVLQGRKVYLHCKLGHGRSPTMLAAYFVRFKKMAPDEALKAILEKRPEVHPNDLQINALRKYAKKIGYD
jgi:protein-tyrosine phosphatase